MRTLWLVNQWNQSCKVTAGSPETHNNLMSRKRSGVWSSPAVFHICSSKNTDSQSLVHFNNFKVEWWWTHQSLKISLASNTDDASQLFSLFEKEETLGVSWWVHLQQAASLIFLRFFSSLHSSQTNIQKSTNGTKRSSSQLQNLPENHLVFFSMKLIRSYLSVHARQRLKQEWLLTDSAYF